MWRSWPRAKLGVHLPVGEGTNKVFPKPWGWRVHFHLSWGSRASLKESRVSIIGNGGGGEWGTWRVGGGGSGRCLLVNTSPMICDTRCVLGLKAGGRTFLSRGGRGGDECVSLSCFSSDRVTKESFILDNTLAILYWFVHLHHWRWFCELC